MISGKRGFIASAEQIARALGGRRAGGSWMCRCPAHDDHSPSLSLTDRGGRVLFRCHAGCAQSAVLAALQSGRLWRRGQQEPPDPAEAERLRLEGERREQRERTRKRDKARWLWKHRAPIASSLAERYLREARGYHGVLPGTLGFIPPRGDYSPAMIAAFGIADEPEPGVLSIADDAVTGIHLTRLTPDARKIPDNAKIMLGPSVGSPICLAPANDLHGMVVAEGIEDALSAHAVTGLGAWAAGSASRLPAMAAALPDYVEAVTILVDADDAGKKFSSELARLLRAREIETRMRHGR